MLVVLSGYVIWKNRHVRQSLANASWTEVSGALRESIWELPLPVFVLGGIYSGYFAVSEAAAVTALYVIIVEMIVLREIPWRELPRIIRESMVLVGAILMILGVSLASTNYMIDAGVPQRLFELVDAYVSGQATFLLAMLIFPAHSWCHPGHIFGDRPGGSAHVARRFPVRNPPGSPGHRLSCSHATGIPDTSGRPESLHRQLPFRAGVSSKSFEQHFPFSSCC